MKSKPLNNETIKNAVCFSGCFAFWCFPCFMSKMQTRTNECPCTCCLLGGKLIEFKKKGKCVFLLDLLGNTGMRTKVRTGFRIRVSNIKFSF